MNYNTTLDELILELQFNSDERVQRLLTETDFLRSKLGELNRTWEEEKDDDTIENGLFDISRQVDAILELEGTDEGLTERLQDIAKKADDLDDHFGQSGKPIDDIFDEIKNADSDYLL